MGMINWKKKPEKKPSRVNYYSSICQERL